MRWVLAVAVRRVEHDRVLPDLGCYEERYRLTGRAALGLAASLLSIGLGLLRHTPVIFAVLAVILAALTVITQGGVVDVGRRMIAFRADHAGIMLGAAPDKLAVRRGAAMFIPRADVERIIVYPAYPQGQGGYARVQCIAVQRREGAPALSRGNEQAPGCPVPGAWRRSPCDSKDHWLAAGPGTPCCRHCGGGAGKTRQPERGHLLTDQRDELLVGEARITE